MKPIGYYNPFAHPVSFTGSHGSMVEISSNAPVTDSDGFLIESNPVLDKQVSDGVLKRIYDTHPDFVNHDSKILKRKGVNRFSAKQIDQMPIEEAKILASKSGKKAKPSKPAPEMLLDSKKGVVNLKTDKLPDGAEMNQDDGTVSYRSKKFASLTALKAYIASTGGASSPNPLSKPAT